MRLSKSTYTQGIQCPKMLWMDCHMSEMRDESVMNQDVLDTGNEVGDLAMGYFGDYVEVPYDPADFDGMIRRTEELIANGVPNVCEATFAYDGNLCMVDILRVEADGVHIVEVKSSTHINDIYFHDMAYQTWVLDKCGMAIKSVSLMHLNGRYVREGKLDLHELFMVEDCTVQVAEMLPDVERNVVALKRIATQDNEPEIAIGRQCKCPYECAYHSWCWRHLPSPSIFDLCRIRIDKALRLSSQGIVSLKDATAKGVATSPRQKVQVTCEAKDIQRVVDGPKVAKFLDTLTFPLYFLDFETMQPAIPPFDGVRPYQQIPTQYSLHVLRAPDAELEHYEFLANAAGDPRRSVAEHLVAHIAMDVCTLAYNMSFEKGRIRELADAYPDLAPHLLNIAENIHDLMTPFSKGWYYDRAMGGSNSIKAVLPALFPNNPELDYHALEGVHNGSEAMRAFEDLYDMEPEEANIVREQLLRYCELDTLAMVRVWEKLREAATMPQ